MLTLVLGGASSGKSAYGEALATAQTGNRVYLATMSATDPESLRRVERHRLQRADLGFITQEEPLDFHKVTVTQGDTVLVEALTTLMANHLYLPQGAGEQAISTILAGIDGLEKQAREVILVSDLIFQDGVTYDPSTQHYIHSLGQLHQALARKADRVVEVVYGIPCWMKGGERI